MLRTAISKLIDRGFVENITQNCLENVKYDIGGAVYAGFDPTAPGLHLGNYSVLMGLRNLQLSGIPIVCLVGGATGMIGDPSGRNKERAFLGPERIGQNCTNIKREIEGLLKHDSNPVKVVNNIDWYRNMSSIEFLSEIGKHFRVSSMLAKDSVQSRLSGTGISFTEFSYQTLQGHDFYYLWKNHGVIAQMGGSDQWGNITAGLDYIGRRTADIQEETHPFGFITPLITNSSGEKFGKSSGNAVFLNSSPHELYQFLINTNDFDVVRYLKLLTTIPLDEIAVIEKEHLEVPDKRIAQKHLATEIITDIYDSEKASMAADVANLLFGNEITSMKNIEKVCEAGGVKVIQISPEVCSNMRILAALKLSGICKSNREAMRLVETGGMYVNNQRVDQDHAREFLNRYMIETSGTFLLRGGKKRHVLLKVL